MENSSGSKQDMPPLTHFNHFGSRYERGWNRKSVNRQKRRKNNLEQKETAESLLALVEESADEQGSTATD